ncbi:MAG: chorismate synthase, partial [Candidatus Hydrogenedentota bacterium]
IKYGPCDDAIGAGFFSGRYTATIVAAGSVAKKILKNCGISVFAFIREAAGVRCKEENINKIKKYTDSFKQMRRDYDSFYKIVYEQNMVTMDMRFLEKMKVFATIEKQIDEIRAKTPKIDSKTIIKKYKVHPVVNCPDIETAESMFVSCNKIAKAGDSSGGVIEVIATGLPVGLGEPVFNKLDGELGRMLGIGAVKGVEIGAGFRVKDMTGSQCNDQMRSQNGKVVFDSNNAGGVTGGLSTGQPLIIRLTIKPTPTIAKEQYTIDKYTLKNKKLAAITRRDQTIVGRIWPVCENYTAIVLLDLLISYYGYSRLRDINQS